MAFEKVTEHTAQAVKKSSQQASFFMFEICDFIYFHQPDPKENKNYDPQKRLWHNSFKR